MVRCDILTYEEIKKYVRKLPSKCNTFVPTTAHIDVLMKNLETYLPFVLWILETSSGTLDESGMKNYITEKLETNLILTPPSENLFCPKCGVTMGYASNEKLYRCECGFVFSLTYKGKFFTPKNFKELTSETHSSVIFLGNEEVEYYAELYVGEKKIEERSDKKTFRHCPFCKDYFVKFKKKNRYSCINPACGFTLTGIGNHPYSRSEAFRLIRGYIVKIEGVQLQNQIQNIETKLDLDKDSPTYKKIIVKKINPEL